MFSILLTFAPGPAKSKGGSEPKIIKTPIIFFPSSSINQLTHHSQNMNIAHSKSIISKAPVTIESRLSPEVGKNFWKDPSAGVGAFSAAIVGGSGLLPLGQFPHQQPIPWLAQNLAAFRRVRSWSGVRCSSLRWWWKRDSSKEELPTKPVRSSVAFHEHGRLGGDVCRGYNCKREHQPLDT